MTVVALVLAGLAALVHVYIFALESLLFDRPSTWKVFGVRGAEEAAVLRPLFLNQGYYNLFLAVVAAAGIGFRAGGDEHAGTALVVAATASMLGAALVLVTSDRALLRGALVQGLLPALSLVALLVAALT